MDLSVDPSQRNKRETPSARPTARLIVAGMLATVAFGLFAITLTWNEIGPWGGALSAALAVAALSLAGVLLWGEIDPATKAQGNADQSASHQGLAQPRIGAGTREPGAGGMTADGGSPGAIPRDFVDGSPMGLVQLDPSGRFVFVNQVLADWLGRDPRELVDNRQKLASFMAQPYAEGAVELSGDVELFGLNGDAFPAHLSRRDVPDAEGGGVRLAVRELAGERELEETLRRAEEGFRRFFDYAPVGIVMVDRSGVAVETNSAFQAMTGLEDEETAADFIKLVSEGDRNSVEIRLEAARRGDHADAPLEVRLAGTEQRIVQLYARRAGGGAGEGGNAPSDLIVYIVDTTELKSLETQVAQSQKMQAVGQLAGGIAHDFNNLLTAMIGYSDLLLQRYSPGDQSFADIMQIKQNANRAANLVRQLLAFSRRQTLQPKVLNLTDVLAELSNLLRRLIGENIELDIVHGRDVGLIRVDQGQLEQVVINLAVNARDAMRDGGALTIRSGNIAFSTPTPTAHETIPPGDYVMIEVADTGTGISADDMVKIFEPFFTTKEVGAGTGLGLSTVYGIIKQTGGFVMAESTPGEGAVFRIYLPEYSAEAAAAEIAAEEEASSALPIDLTGKETILLVEDEDPVRLFAARALENKGYTVLPADCAEEAMELVEEFDGKIDLAITDVVMPQMDGPTFISWMVERAPDIKVIYISGYAEDAFRNTIAGNRPYDFLPKPFSLKELAVKVKTVMDA